MENNLLLERRRYKNNWQKNYRSKFKIENGYSSTSNYSVGGMRRYVLDRDNNRCVKCGMPDEEHKNKYGRPITIDHKDRNRKNNTLDNLQTLCLSCHGKKDIVQSIREKKFEKFVPEAILLRSAGKTYQQIADEFKVSIATAWKYLKNWSK